MLDNKFIIKNLIEQAEAEVVPSSSLVEAEVGVEVVVKQIRSNR